jgi:site-specific DNA recombinase
VRPGAIDKNERTMQHATLLAAIYTRYSTERQRDTSTLDQLRNCERKRTAEGLDLFKHYSDEAMSGQTTDRPGYQEMISDAIAGEFKVLIIDDLSRLGRDSVETERTIQRLEFRKVRIIGVCDGYDSDSKARKIHRGAKNLVNEIYIDDLREKTHRGQEGQALRKFVAGGKTYAYKHVPEFDTSRVDNHGMPLVNGYRREVDESKAEIVREIFQRYAAGESMLRIASDLNARAIPSPGAAWKRKTRRKDGRWLVSTLHSLLYNEIYIGRYIWNRCEWIRDPDTKKRTKRERPRSEWTVNEIPELAIVDVVTWDRVAARLRASSSSASAIAQRKKRGRGPKFILSGVLECGLCSTKMIVSGSSERNSYRCASRHGGGEFACSNDLTVRRDLAEELLLEPLRKEVLADSSIDYVLGVIRKLWIEAQQPSVPPEQLRRIAQLEGEIAQLNRLVADGVLSAGVAGAALERAQVEHSKLIKARERVPVTASTAILFRAEAAYRARVAMLRESLSGQDVHMARELLRPLVGGSIPCLPAEFGARHLVARVGLDPIALLAGSAMEKLVAGAGSGLIHRQKASYSVALIRAA